MSNEGLTIAINEGIPPYDGITPKNISLLDKGRFNDEGKIENVKCLVIDNEKTYRQITARFDHENGDISTSIASYGDPSR